MGWRDRETAAPLIFERKITPNGSNNGQFSPAVPAEKTWKQRIKGGIVSRGKGGIIKKKRPCHESKRRFMERMTGIEPA